MLGTKEQIRREHLTTQELEELRQLHSYQENRYKRRLDSRLHRYIRR